MTKKIGFIGNSLSGDLAALLLPKEYEVSRFMDCESVIDNYPFYGNDLTAGIMKQFLKDAQMDIPEIEKTAEQLTILLDGKKFVFDMEFSRFESQLIEYFIEEEERIKLLFDEIRKVGEEWSAFISSRFNGKLVKFISSSKYYNKNVEDVIAKVGIKSPQFIQLFKVILPVKETTFSVFAGYLYTQFFDICSTPYDILKELRKEGQRKVRVNNVQDISSLVISDIEVIENSETLDPSIFHSVIDLRPNRKINENNVRLGKLLGDVNLSSENLYIIRHKKELVIKIWNSGILTSETTSSWYFEAMAYDQREVTLTEIEECLELTLRQNCQAEWLYQGKLDQTFDLSEGSGYSWAFNKKESALDPTNLIRKQVKPTFICSHWGFAWFSAAYHIVNVIENQMLFSSDRYKVQTNTKEG